MLGNAVIGDGCCGGTGANCPGSGGCGVDGIDGDWL